jgi:acetylornithine/N-succinyldiaminopimelate aminotransferase
MENIIWTTGHRLKFGNIIHSDNYFVFDENGKRLVDLESGVWCTSVGHNNKRINSLIASQINRITHTGFCYCSPVIAEVSQKVLEITGLFGGKCEFLCSGSEAVELGMRIARSIVEKPLALTFSDSYFGAYGEAAKRPKDSWFVYNRLQCACASDQTGCLGECDDFHNIPLEKIGIFLFEPGSSSGLVRFPSVELIQKVVARVRANGGLVMANEITTGAGRTGKWFGYQHYYILPDIVAMGKGIGNGYPVSITAISADVAKKLSETRFFYAQSHQNDPLGAMVAGEVINIINEDHLLERCNEIGNFLLESLRRLKKEFPVIREVRGRGLMLAIEFGRDALGVYEELLKKGFILFWRPNTEVLRLDPALTVRMTTIVDFLNAFGQVLENVSEKKHSFF